MIGWIEYWNRVDAARLPRRSEVRPPPDARTAPHRRRGPPESRAGGTDRAAMSGREGGHFRSAPSAVTTLTIPDRAKATRTLPSSSIRSTTRSPSGSIETTVP